MTEVGHQKNLSSFEKAVETHTGLPVDILRDICPTDLAEFMRPAKERRKAIYFKVWKKLFPFLTIDVD